MTPAKEDTIKNKSAEWLASCGFIFPTNEAEMIRFRRLHGPVDPAITGQEVNPKKILLNANKETRKRVTKAVPVRPLLKEEPYQMVARKRSSPKKTK